MAVASAGHWGLCVAEDTRIGEICNICCVLTLLRCYGIAAVPQRSHKFPTMPECCKVGRVSKFFIPPEQHGATSHSPTPHTGPLAHRFTVPQVRRRSVVTGQWSLISTQTNTHNSTGYPWEENIQKSTPYTHPPNTHFAHSGPTLTPCTGVCFDADWTRRSAWGAWTR